MSELLKKQNYGVEVEFTGITRAMAAEAVAEVIGSTVTGPDHTCYHTRIIRDSQGRKWKIMTVPLFQYAKQEMRTWTNTGLNL